MAFHNLKLTTARLYWQKSGEDSWLDFGNAAKYARKPRIERLKHSQNSNGLQQVDLNMARETEVLWTFSFDERFGELMRPLWLANAGSAVTNAGSTATSTIANDSGQIKVGRSYQLKSGGAAVLGITAVNSANDDVPNTLIEGTHYTLDRVTGMFTVLSIPGGATDNWNFNVTWAAYNQEALIALKNLLTQGTFKVVEKDAQDDAPFNEETFVGQVYVTAWGENDMSKFSEYDVEVLHNPGNA
jgi:hypothetical protein